MCLKTDSFVVESNVHFPTDYNLLWDSARKCLDMVDKFLKEYPEVPGWRKKGVWYRQLKNSMRAVDKVSSSGGKGKEQRVKRAVRYYLSVETSKPIQPNKKKEPDHSDLTPSFYWVGDTGLYS